MAPQTHPNHLSTNKQQQQQQLLLRDVLRQNNVLVGGSSIGKGFVKAASYHLDHDDGRSGSGEAAVEDGVDEKKDDNDNDGQEVVDVLRGRREDPFYVVDLGVVVSQVYQWWKLFPRVQAFYAVKCNPDPVVVRTLAIMGLNFDCASRTEIQLVKECCKDLPQQPEIIYANPCKAPTHIQDAVSNYDVRMMTFDNINEVIKCSKISTEIQLIMRIATDDQGSRCRFSTKFGAPRIKWRPLLAAAKKHSLKVVGVSFHVGSGCHDASKYDLALRDAREIFDIASKEYGMDMTIVDIGGGFPGETHSLWNPAKELDGDEADNEDNDVADEDEKEGQSDNSQDKEEEAPLVYFQEIAESVAPAIDKYFPKESGVRIIGEPGRYLVAAAATLCCSIIGLRDNQLDSEFVPEPVDDKEAAMMVNDMTREDECEVIDAASGNIFESSKKLSMGQQTTDDILGNIVDELADYTRMFARQNLAQQEVDTYNDSIDVYALKEEQQLDVLGVPETGTDTNTDAAQTVEGMNSAMLDMVDSSAGGDAAAHPLVTLAGAGEAAVSGLVMQAVADASAAQDDYAVYINDGVYGAMNNIMFDHANLRPRVLHKSENKITATDDNDGMSVLDPAVYTGPVPVPNQELFATTVFGPTCDSIDVVARSVLLPKLQIGDWLYFQNMGAYTMAAASSFNGFEPSEKVYVCSIHPEYIEKMMAGPDAVEE